MVRFIQTFCGSYRRRVIPSQFHYGSIHTQAFLLGGSFDNLVSIPLWFDSYQTIYQNVLNNMQRLNSTMVRFIQSLTIFLPKEEACLNSTMVRFIPQLRRTLCLSSCLVSIPLWFDSYRCTPADADSLSVVSIPLWFDSYMFKTIFS